MVDDDGDADDEVFGRAIIEKSLFQWLLKYKWEYDIYMDVYIYIHEI